MSDVTRLVWDMCATQDPGAEGVREQTTFHAGNGCPGLTQRIVNVEPGRPIAPRRRSTTCCSCSRARARSRTRARSMRSSARPASTSARRGVRGHGGRRRPARAGGRRDPEPASGVELGERRVTLRLDEAEAQKATADREFRLVVTPEAGCASVTQFVGYIPVGRAPDHFHTYDEVLYVLSGEGVLHIGDSHQPVGEGACVHFSPELVHSLENVGPSRCRCSACSGRRARRRRRTTRTGRGRRTDGSRRSVFGE